jgi:hypothetical protein
LVEAALANPPPNCNVQGLDHGKIVSLRSAIAQEANAGMKKGGPKAAPPSLEEVIAIRKSW